MCTENNWLLCYPEQTELCTLQYLMSWDHSAYKETHSVDFLHRENPTGKSHSIVGFRGQGCVFLFFPHYLAHCLTHDRYSKDSEHSITEGRKGGETMRYIYLVIC